MRQDEQINSTIRSPDVPVILEMKPKEARRAWARYMADAKWISDNLYQRALMVSAAIETVILNKEYHAEVLTRQHLADRLDEFRALISQNAR